MIRTYTSIARSPTPWRNRRSVGAIAHRTAVRHARESPITPQSRLIRVASVPAAHPYIRSIVDARCITVIPDPPVPGGAPGQWWPPVILTPDWISAHADEVDVIHVHFGIESFGSDELSAALAAARRRGCPVVFTVHDLDNPQLTDQTHYQELLEVLLPAADVLLTLTGGAAAEISRRWGRDATVLPHPTLLGAVPPVVARADTALRIGIHLRDLRPSIAADEGVAAAGAAAALLAEAGADVRVEIVMNDRVRDEAMAARIEAAASTHPAVALHRRARLTDAEVAAWLGGLDLFVLPYHHGTHSGWVELCYDLGVRVAGTSVGHMSEQHPDEFAVIDLADPATLVAAVQDAAAHRLPDPGRAALLQARRGDRLAQRDTVRAAHTNLYTALARAADSFTAVADEVGVRS